MAETIAKSWLSQHFDTKHIKVSSTGTRAKINNAVSPEAVIALARHNIPHKGESKQLTIELIKQHDLIFVMTKEHLEHTQEIIAQNKTDKTPIVKTLHPDRDLADPLGKGQQAYDELADELIELIPLQLKEFLNLAQH